MICSKMHCSTLLYCLFLLCPALLSSGKRHCFPEHSCHSHNICEPIYTGHEEHRSLNQYVNHNDKVKLAWWSTLSPLTGVSLQWTHQKYSCSDTKYTGSLHSLQGSPHPSWFTLCFISSVTSLSSSLWHFPLLKLARSCIFLPGL